MLIVARAMSSAEGAGGGEIFIDSVMVWLRSCSVTRHASYLPTSFAKTIERILSICFHHHLFTKRVGVPCLAESVRSSGHGLFLG